MPKYDAVPDIACRYERYDPTTLKPENESTYVRLIETGWTEDTFKGRSVLDIGCNSGALSIFAHNLGAINIQAVDVMHQFVDFFSDIVADHDLPIKVDKIGFNELTPDQNGADVVLCMEVLHWVVHQGGTLPEAIAHLASLTNETLYIETPWDTNEPSIANRDNYPVENYDIELIIRGLARHFETVKIERYMTYFGEMENSKRVLISATGKRQNSLPLKHITDANHSGISLSRGMNQTTLVTTTKGVKALKSVPGNSAFVLLNDDDVENLGVFLTEKLPKSVVVTPERIDGVFRKKEEDGHTYMLFPFLGAMGDYFPKRANPSAVRDPMALAVNLFRHFSLAEADVVAPLQDLFGRLPLPKPQELPAKYRLRIEAAGLMPFIANVISDLTDYDPALEDGLLHNDMQLGNFIHTPRGVDRIVDLDILRAGPAFADILSCALHTGADESALDAAILQAEGVYGRKAGKFDCAFCVGSGLLWLNARVAQESELRDASFERFISGLKVQEKLYNRLQAMPNP